MFEIGKEYNRQSEIHDVYGGIRQTGISPSRQSPIVFLFSSPKGEDYGYKDGWISKTEYSYTGEGTLGDMVMKSGNKAIRDHEEEGRALHLFIRKSIGVYEYTGEFQYVEHEMRRLPDANKTMRDAIVFKLRLVH